jgi:hypothetical protein
MKCSLPELALLRHTDGHLEFPLLREDRKLKAHRQNDAFDPGTDVRIVSLDWQSRVLALIVVR